MHRLLLARLSHPTVLDNHKLSSYGLEVLARNEAKNHSFSGTLVGSNTSINYAWVGPKAFLVLRPCTIDHIPEISSGSCVDFVGKN
ncbi:hypothetical protein RRG08_016303 [Elysia crispata]|uniref:Uncharacterized protein n=1 Tax=Elysia crispata TaxID=231223 RepID=A0AAE0ZVM5_9GAST|nr:hypothetical protein RRG08_016303 [Elysia crispata]